MTRRTKIVATIGPASQRPRDAVEMVDAGMDVARLNFSHGTPEQHAETCARVRTAADRAGRPVAVLQDLPGPKLRIGPLRDGLAELAAGDRVTFVGDDGGDTEGDERRMAINWPALASADRAGRGALPRRRRRAPARRGGARRATARSRPSCASAAPSPRARA